MKKQILLLVAGVFLSVTSIFAQQPTNAGFETWPSSDVPTGWGTTTQVLTQAGLSGQGLETQNTNATYITQGTSSIKLLAKLIGAPVNQTFPGFASLGSLVFSGGGATPYGQAFTGRPDSISFTFAYIPSGGDSALFQIVLTKNTALVGGTGGYIPIAVPVMSKITVAIPYQNASTPDTLSIQFNTGYNKVTAGSILYVDDVKLIYNTPAVPTVSIAAIPTSALESAGTAKFVATLSSAPTTAVTVGATFTGTAANPADYTLSKNSFSFAVGKTKDTITVNIVDDAVVESSETVIATLGTPSGATLGTPSSATFTIVDNDGTPVVPTVSIAASVSSIGEAGVSYKLIGTLSQGTSVVTGVSVNFTGTATNTVDYSYNKSAFGFAAGKVTDTITVTIVDDAVVESNETIIATLGTPSACTIGSPASATTTIVDNDAAALPTVSVVASQTTVVENVGTVKLIATLSAASASTVTVATTVTGTATNPSDYTLSKTSFSFAAGKTKDTITVTIVNDAIFEPTETVIVTLSSPSGATVGSPASSTITITDNDPSGIEQNDLLKAISVYPNPARESFKVEMPSDAANHTVSIVDVTGRTVKQAEVVAGSNTISINGITSGNYTLMFVNSTEQKLVGTKQLQITK